MTHMSTRATSADDPTLAAPAILVMSTVATTLGAFLLDQVRLLGEHGWRVELAAGSEPSVAVAEMAAPYHRLPLSRRPTDVRGHLATVRALRTLIRRRRFDVLYVHTPIAAALARLATLTLPEDSRPEVVYFAHGFHFLAPADRGVGQRGWYLLERTCARWTSRLIVINRTDLASTDGWPIARAGGVRYLPGVGIDPLWYDAGAVPAADTTSWSAEHQVERWVACIAEFTPNKRHPLLLEALTELPATVGLVLVGDSEGRAVVEQRVAELGLAGRVHFAGLLQDVRPVFAAAAATVLVSRREGLPRSLMESLCMGVPIAVTDTRGAVDLARAAGCPVATTDTAPGVAEAIRRALADARPPAVIRQTFLEAWADGLEPRLSASVVAIIDELQPERSAG